MTFNATSKWSLPPETIEAAFNRFQMALLRTRVLALTFERSMPCTHKSRLGDRLLPRTTCADCVFRRSSAAVATSREVRRPPRLGQGGQHRR
jgi:hypothetical protein